MTKTYLFLFRKRNGEGLNEWLAICPYVWR
ncbi:MAG: hypothetical protein K0Q59_4622 [Paenibacillus sp.]|nr:hypothetical protein [Paenibacillus sp.]